MMLMAVLTLAWGCSSSSGDDGNAEQWNGSTYIPAAKPTWAVNWTSTATAPDWKNPDPTKFDSSMHILVDVEGELASNSTDNDMMAIFIDGECRGVSRRNVAPNGSVSFLLFLKGSGVEADRPMELRYYCDKLHHINVVPSYMGFKPNNILDKDYMKVFNIGKGSSKYPVCTELTVMMPQKMPFTASSGDMLAVFVGDECRGVGSRNADAFGSWNVLTYGVKAGETAQIRYYSDEKSGVYTLLKTIELKGTSQQESISF